MKTRKLLLLTAAVAALVAIGTVDASAQSIGCNFVTNSVGGIDNTELDSLLPTDSAGAPPFAQTNWNNLSSGNSSGTYVLTDSLGASHTLKLQWSSWATTVSGTLSAGTPDGKLLNYGLSTWNPGAATTLGNSCANSSGNNQPLVYIGGLNAWWTSVAGAEGYRVILYTKGDGYWEVEEGYIESVSGDPLTNGMVEGTSLTPHLFGTDNSSGTTYAPATGTSAASSTSGANYMALNGATNDAILLRLQTTGYGQGLNGFQLVPIFPTMPTAATPVFSPSATIYAGQPATVTEAATGDLLYTNLCYQWQSDVSSSGVVTNNLLNATNSTYTFTPPDLGSNYTISLDVIVTNVYGAVTSSVATLNVTVIPPFVATDTTPGQGNGSANVYAFANGSVTFSAAFAGPAPITTQWEADTGSGYADIPGATNGSVTVTNLQSSNDGNYLAHASNAYGSGDSTPAPLTVLDDPAPPSASEPYAYMIFTNHPVAYWRFNETTLDVIANSVQAYDYSGHNLNATYGHGTAVFDNGLNSSSFPGFESDNPSVSLLNGFDGSSLTAPSLNLNTNTVTISMWINPNAVVGTYWGLFMWANGSDKAGLGFGGTQATNSSGIAVAELGYTWNTNSSATYNFNSNLYPPAGQWSFVSLVITPTNSTIYLYYTDGSGTHVSKAVQSITNSPESFNGGTIWIGSDSYSGRNFDGYIDEVSVFNRSLSETEIQNLFQAGSGVAGVTPYIASDINPTNVNTFAGLTLKLTADGDGMPVPTYQWQAGTGGVFTNLVNGDGVSGVNSSTLTMAAPTAADSLNYRLLLSNTYGYATSSICPVSLSPVPTNGLWTACFQVTNSDNQVGYVHASGSYSGQGVLGHGGYWNVIPGAGMWGYANPFMSVSDYKDDGSTHSGISCGIYGGGLSLTWGGAVYPTKDIRGLLSQYIYFTTTNTVTNAIVLSGVPDGTYNLAFHGINGQTCNHGTTFTAHGVNGDQSASTANQQFQYFRNGDTTAIITNVQVSGGTLNVDMTPMNPVPNFGNTNNEVDVNGIEIQLVSYAPVTAGFSILSTNVFETQPVTFTDASTGGTNWFWDFGDGNTHNSQTRGATHAYAATGNYTVIQTVKGPSGTASATNSVDIQVLPKPIIGSVTMSAGSLVLNGTGGISGQPYRILTSTNLALPLWSWTTVETGAFAADGSYSYTNSTPTNQASFFILVSP